MENSLLIIGGNFSLLGRGEFTIFLNIALLLIFLYFLSFPLIYLANLIRVYKQKMAVLELTPPGYADISLTSFNKLFESLSGLSSELSLKDRLLKRKVNLTFELLATKGKGIKFRIIMPEASLSSLKKTIRANLPGTSLSIVDDSNGLNANLSKTISFKLKRPFSQSLKILDAPILPYMAALTELQEQEVVALRLNISPLSFRFNHKALKRDRAKKRGWLVKLALLPLKVIKPKSTAKEEVKLGLPLFKTAMAVKIAGTSQKQLRQRAGIFKSSLSVLTNPGKQALVANVTPLKRPMILSTEELASLYHFPGAYSVGSELVKRSQDHTLAVNVNSLVKQPDIVLGQNLHSDQRQDIGLTKDERKRHLYIIGGTGNGKTTMLEYMASQDIQNGNGLMVVDPHGDLALSLLKRIPKNRIKDVIYFNPHDISYPIGLNLLELSKGLSPTKLALEKDSITEAVISVFRKTFDGNDSSGAYRIERLLRHAIHTALTVEDPTLFTVSRILADKYYRWEVVQCLNDAKLKRFWLEEFNKAGDYQRVKMSLGSLTRLERFENNLAIKRVIGQINSGFSFDQVINSKKILICNLSKGLIGEEASSVLGSLLLAKLELAALARQNVGLQKRTPFYLYVDEFQNYANPSFLTMFSEARKYGIYLTIAQQSAAQLKDKGTFNIILDNVGSLVTFRSKSLDTEKLLLPQFAPFVGKNEIANLSRYSFYAKIAATESRQPVSGKTVLVDYPKTDYSKQIINFSRKEYAGWPEQAPKVVA